MGTLRKFPIRIGIILAIALVVPITSGFLLSHNEPTTTEICESLISRWDNKPWGGIVKLQNLFACKEVSAEKLTQALSVYAVRANYHEFTSEAGPFHLWFNQRIIASTQTVDWEQRPGGEIVKLVYHGIAERINGIQAFALGDCSELPDYPNINSDLVGRIAVIYPCPAGD